MPATHQTGSAQSSAPSDCRISNCFDRIRRICSPYFLFAIRGSQTTDEFTQDIAVNHWRARCLTAIPNCLTFCGDDDRFEASLRTWARLSAKKSAQREACIRFETLPEFEDRGDSPITSVLKAERLARLSEIISQLPPTYSEVLYHVLEGATVADIASKLRIPSSTVQTRFHRGRKRIARLWNKGDSGAD